VSCAFTTIDQWIHYYLHSFSERDSDRRQSLSRRSSGMTPVAEACTAVPLHWQNNSRHHSTEYWCHKLWSMPGELVQSSIERMERLCSFEQSNACSQLVIIIIFICHCINKIYVTGINETSKRLIICKLILTFVVCTVPYNNTMYNTTTHYTVGHKMRDSKLFATTFANIDRFR